MNYYFFTVKILRSLSLGQRHYGMRKVESGFTGLDAEFNGIAKKRWGRGKHVR